MDAKWLNDQFNKYPAKNKGDLSNLLGMQPSAISKMLAGTRQIKAREYMLMRKFFDIPTSNTPGKKQAYTSSDGILYAAEKSASTWQNSSAKSYDLVEVSDISMVPDFLPGEKVLIDRNISLDQKAGIFAIEEAGQSYIRILEALPPSKIRISTLIKDTPPRTLSAKHVKITGRVIAKLNWL